MKIPHKCPVCNGTGLVSRPPGIAGDVDTYSSGQTTWKCTVCKGEKVLWVDNVQLGLLQGWQCPKCGKCLGPFTQSCNCHVKVTCTF